MSKYVPNRSFADDFAKDPAAREILTFAAETMVPFVDRIASQAGEPFIHRPGHELIEVQEDAEGVYVMNTDYGGHWAEWGSRNTPIHAPMRRGVRAAGYRLSEE